MSKRAWRYTFFTLTILIGFAVGLGYGWLINPIRIGGFAPPDNGISLDRLPIDYRTDFVLMVAELYQAEGDLPLALDRLDLMGDSPLLSMTEAITYADSLNYAEVDLQLMRNLAFVVQQFIDNTD